MGKNRDQRGQGLRDRVQAAAAEARDKVEGLADNLAERLETLADRVQQPPGGRIRRVVVLMLENRSFDHMMGWLPPELGGLPEGASNPAALDRNEIYASLGRGAIVILGLFAFAGIILRIRRF